MPDVTQPPEGPGTSEGQATVYLRQLLDPSTQWLNSSLNGVLDVERALQLNKSMQFRRNNTTIQFCLVVSQGNEHVATIRSDAATSSIEVAVYCTGADSIQEVWNSRVPVLSDPADSSWSSGGTTMSLKGYISGDGERLLVQYSVNYGRSIYYATSNKGAQWTRLKLKAARSDSSLVSNDDEYIFFQRTGRGFKSRDQGEIIEAVSTRTWKSSKTWTFVCQPGSVHRNLLMLPSLFIDKPVACAVDAGQNSSVDKKLCVICFSNGQQFHIQLDQFRAASSVWVSPDRRHMVHIPEDDGQVSYWDIAKPTFHPLFSLDLPKVEKAPKYMHRIHGKDTLVRHTINKQVRCCRFSPAGEVVTIAVGNDCCIVINSFLTHNFQLVYQKVFNYELCLGWVVQHIAIEEARGVSVFGAVPHTGDGAGVFGLRATFAEIPGAYSEIRKLEDYFDNVEANIQSVTRGIPPIHSWNVTDIGIHHDVGPIIPPTQFDRESQAKLDDTVFRGQYSTSPYQGVDSRIVHLVTVSYPWSQTGKAAIFLVRMKHEFYIMAIGMSSIQGLEPYLIRVVHVSDTLFGHEAEQIEIFCVNEQLILRASRADAAGYSGVQFPMNHVTALGHHFMRNDAEYDLFIIKSSTSVVMPSGWNTTPNTAIVFTASFAAYFPPQYLGCGDHLDYGFRRKSNYNMAKFLLWLSFPHRSRRNDPFFSGGELMDNLGKTYDGVFDDRIYDEEEAPFQAILSCAADIDAICHRTVFVDEFLKRYHQSDALVIANSQTISLAMPALCRARPLGVLSLIRRFSLFDFRVPANNGVVVVTKAYEAKPRMRLRLANYPVLEVSWIALVGLLSFFAPILRIVSSSKGTGLANARTVTIPLDGFCMHKRYLQGLPRFFRVWDFEPSNVFYGLAGPAYYKNTPRADLPIGLDPYRLLSHPPMSSPFTSFVEEVMDLDRDLQGSILKVIWLEKLVAWKMDTFGRTAYLQRIVLPLSLNVALQLALSILTADGSKPTAGIVLAAVQIAVLVFLTYQKFRQMLGTRLFFRSIYSYFDLGAIALSTTMAVMVLSRNTPPRAFIAYSMPILWIDLILTSRVFQQAGTLMILLTEMTRGVLPFLCLLAFFIVGFTFIPFFLLQAETPPTSASDSFNPFSDYGRALGEMITFMSNDFNSLDPWKDNMVSIRILRAIFTVVVSILLLNCLIALLNLKVEAADRKSRNIWIRQMAMLLVEIEKGLLTESERQNPHWFPRWFTYTLTESERRDWENVVSNEPLDLGYGPGGDGKNSKSGNGVNTANLGSDLSAPTLSKPAGSTTVAASQPVEASSQPSTSSVARPPTPEPQSSPKSETANDATKPQEPPVPSIVNESTAVPESAPSINKPTPTTYTTSSALRVPSPTQDALPIPIDETSSIPMSVLTDAQQDKCQICDNATTMVCSTCKLARYCSVEHQTADWKDHKKKCKGKGKAEA